MTKPKWINARMPRVAVRWMTVLLILALIFLFMMIPGVTEAVAKWIKRDGESLPEAVERVENFIQYGFVLSVAFAVIILGLKLSVFAPWLGVPFVILGLVAVVWSAFNIWSNLQDDPLEGKIDPHEG